MVTVSPERAKQPNAPVTEKERTDLRASLGEQIWATDQTAVHGAFNTSSVASKVQSATVSTLLENNKSVRRLRGEEVVLYFGPLQGDLCVYTYGDSSKGKPPQRGMITAVGETLRPGQNLVRCNFLRWASKRQKRSLSATMATESLAAEAAVDINFATRRALQEALNMPQPPHGVVLTDSWSLTSNIYSITPHISEEDLTPSLQRVREACVGWQRIIADKVLPLDLIWVPDADMIADVLTKPHVNPRKVLDPIASGVLDFRRASQPKAAQQAAEKAEFCGVGGIERSDKKEVSEKKEDVSFSDLVMHGEKKESATPILDIQGQKLYSEADLRPTSGILLPGVAMVQNIARRQALQYTRADFNENFPGRREDLEEAARQSTTKAALLKSSLADHSNTIKGINTSSSSFINTSSSSFRERPSEVARQKADKEATGTWIASKKSRGRERASKDQAQKYVERREAKEFRAEHRASVKARDKARERLLGMHRDSDSDEENDHVEDDEAILSTNSSESIKEFKPRNLKRSRPSDARRKKKEQNKKKNKLAKKQAEAEKVQAASSRAAPLESDSS
jgi:hypothetical protein